MLSEWTLLSLSPCVWCEGVRVKGFPLSGKPLYTSPGAHSSNTSFCFVCHIYLQELNTCVAASQPLCCAFITDIDECATGRHTCGPEQTCYNTRGSFMCQCLPGYLRNGDRCVGEMQNSLWSQFWRKKQMFEDSKSKEVLYDFFAQ